jgi:transcriptional regulator with PAS, ATPase and Fis domain
LGTQARLLRVLENGEFIKVGSSKVQKTDVRVVAATNVNLFQAVDRGKFREDLYYRLNTVPIFVPPLRDRGNDIELLFRKFAMDYSEKYRTPPLKLNSDAIEALLKYRFPGNIRQLKNLVEQMSVLETNREIDGNTLNKYLPANSKNQLPMLFGADTSKEELSEREILYKVLFDMKKDVTELKRLVFENLRSGQASGDILKEHENLFHNLDEDEYEKTNYHQPTKLISESRQPKPIELDKYQDIQDHEESLSLEDKEKEMILKALRKNQNKRKYAAQDLGISERTLYRKIKQYEIE